MANAGEAVTLRPTRFFVQYGEPSSPDADEDPANYRKRRDFETLSSARLYAKKVPSATIHERKNVVPSGDPHGLLWDSDDEVIE